MTPGELRRWAKGYELQGRREIADILDGAADAWENDKKVARYAVADLGKMQDQYDALRKRLEAARQMLYDIADAAGPDDWGVPTKDDIDAALAGEK